MISAGADMLQRMGAGQMRIGHTDEDDGEPVVWYVTAFFKLPGTWEAAGAMSPASAMFRLLERAMDGGTCQHCKRPTGVVDDTQAADMPGTELICWYAFDPELTKFRRSCEGET